MSKLRTDLSLEALNERGKEYLPGYLGIRITELQSERVTSRMPSS